MISPRPLGSLRIGTAAGIASAEAVGDARAPGTIAMAVYAGRRSAEELDAAPSGDAVPFRRELTELAQEPLADVQLSR